MSLTAGARLGSYEIHSVIGAGGMGEVYRAVDTRLGRSVALNTIPDSFSNDADRLARFEREARTLATLNHPHIAQIYGLEESQGTRALVMELVDGEDLAQRLARGPIPVRDVLRMASQIAEAIEAAHEQGVIHRDLKPANIKVTRDGLVKVLDFGLAKAGSTGSTGSTGSAGSAGSDVAVTSPAMTQAGMILGTAAYMSPEQAHGREADKRSDVWAFGCVLYEMLTGRRAFAGSDVVDTLAAVVRAEPDFSGWPSDAPPTIRMLVQSCLTKDRRERVSDIAAARYALRQATRADSTTAAAMPAVVNRSRERWYAIAAALSIVMAVAMGALLMRRPTASAAPAPPIIRLSLLPPVEHAFRPSGVDRDFAITPDGLRFVYRTREGLLAVRSLDSLEPKVIAGTENARTPFMSPDGRWIGYWASGAIRKIPVEGGASVTIAQSSSAPRGHTWSADNTIVFADNSGEGLRRVSATGGAVEALTKLASGEQGHTNPSYLPDGQSVLFTILAGGADRRQIGLLDLRTGRYKVLVKEGSQPIYVEPGYVVFQVANTLRAVRFDRERAEVSGEPVTAVENVASSNTGSSNSDIAKNGTLVYLEGSVQAQDRSFVWVDRSGKLTPIAQPSRPYVYPRVARDGVRLVADVRDAEQDIWIADVRRGTMTRLSFGPSLDAYPVWMPDGRALLYASSRDGAQAIFRQAADGTGGPQRVAAGQEGEGLPVSVSPDGQYAIVRSRGRLKALSLSGGMPIDMQSLGEAGQLNGDISPDGRWLAFDSTESGRSEVYVRPFPRLNDGRWQVSMTGGSKPVWAPGGRELFYEDQSAWIVAAPVESGASFSSGVPRRLFEARNMVIGTTTIRSWDVAPDGRFLMIQDSSVNNPNAGPPVMTVVLNWAEELKSKLPARPR